MWFLYDQRYAESGNMLRMLSMGMLIAVISSSYNGLLWANGMVRISVIILAAQIVIQVVSMIIGHYFLGVQGVVLSAAIAAWLIYPIQAYAHARINLWDLKVDLPFIILSVFVVALNFPEVFNHV